MTKGITILGTEVPETTRGIVYLCKFTTHPLKLIVLNELFFGSEWLALNAYAEIPNPESQLISGSTYEILIDNLNKLHRSMTNIEWLKELEECI
jgi:hypothetical protein